MLGPVFGFGCGLTRCSVSTRAVGAPAHPREHTEHGCRHAFRCGHSHDHAGRQTAAGRLLHRALGQVARGRFVHKEHPGQPRVQQVDWVRGLALRAGFTAATVFAHPESCADVNRYLSGAEDRECWEGLAPPRVPCRVALTAFTLQTTHRKWAEQSTCGRMMDRHMARTVGHQPTRKKSHEKSLSSRLFPCFRHVRGLHLHKPYRGYDQQRPAEHAAVHLPRVAGCVPWMPLAKQALSTDHSTVILQSATLQIKYHEG